MRGRAALLALVAAALLAASPVSQGPPGKGWARKESYSRSSGSVASRGPTLRRPDGSASVTEPAKLSAASRSFLPYQRTSWPASLRYRSRFGS